MPDNPARGRPSAAEVIAETLREEIAQGLFSEAGVLPSEPKLIERFGVSRPTCREALRVLQSEGLVSILRGNRGGARVNPPDADHMSRYAAIYLRMTGASLVEVFEARLLVEPEAAARVSQRGTPAIYSALAENIARQRFLVGDRPAFYQAGRVFREVLLDNCGNEPIRLMGRMLGHVIDQQLTLLSFRLPKPEIEETFERGLEIKKMLLEAIIDGSERDSRQFMADYLTHYMGVATSTVTPEITGTLPFAID
jgi:DNA-binding FadR family transcriptional regulator